MHTKCVKSAANDDDNFVYQAESFKCAICTSLETLQSRGPGTDGTKSCLQVCCSSDNHVDFNLMSAQLAKLSAQVDSLTSSVAILLKQNEELKLLLSSKMDVRGGSHVPPGDRAVSSKNSINSALKNSSAHPGPICNAQQQFPVSYSQTLTQSSNAQRVQEHKNGQHKNVQHSSAQGPRSNNNPDGFTLVSHKKTNMKKISPAFQQSGSHNVNKVPPKPNRIAQIGIRSSALIKAVQPVKVRTRAIFISRVTPTITEEDLKSYLSNEISITNVEVVRLKTRNNNDHYASFHVKVPEDKFEIVNSSVIWPEGILFKPFLGPLRDDKLYKTPVPPAPDDNSVPSATAHVTV